MWCPAGGLRHSAIGSERPFAHRAPSQPTGRGVAAERPRRAETTARSHDAPGPQPARPARWTRTGQVSDGLVAPLGAQTSWSVKPKRPRWVASSARDETQAPACMREYLTGTHASSPSACAWALFGIFVASNLVPASTSCAYAWPCDAGAACAQVYCRWVPHPLYFTQAADAVRLEAGATTSLCCVRYRRDLVEAS